MEYKKWKPGDPVLINNLRWDQKEVDSVLSVFEKNWFGGNSEHNKKFEDAIKRFSGFKHFQSTNSGSAALEIAIQVLKQSGRIKTGDKFLHPAVTFPTSFTAAVMAGMIPVFVDSDEGTYQISTEGIKRALVEHPDIKFAIIPALLGNIPDMEVLINELNGRFLIVDSCDLVGGKFDGKEFSTFGDFGCYSFYGSHHISSGGVGGGIGTNSDDDFELIRSMTFWGRDFSTDKLNKIDNFLKRYSYKTLGLDAQMTALQAAFGLVQMERLSEFIGTREAMFRKLQNLFRTKLNYFILPTRTSDRADPSWFCYPLVIRRGTPFTREEFATFLIEHNIEVRPIMAGNVLNHAPFQNIKYHTVDDLRVADEVFNRGLFIPLCPMESDQMEYYFGILSEFINKY